MRNFIFVSIVVILAISARCEEPSSTEQAINGAVERLLRAYSAKNVPAFLALVDPAHILVLGTDRSEKADSVEKVRELLESDFRFWSTSEFGPPDFVSVRAGESLASAAFDVPFTMRRLDRHVDTVTIRFLTVWRREGDRWLLTQSLNSVPSTRQSAREISAGEKK